MNPFYDPAENEILISLIRNGVNFIVVGGAAVQFYGVERARPDIDILLQATHHNSEALSNALAEFGIVLNELTLSDNKESHLPNPYGFIHLMTSISGVSYEKAEQQKVDAYVSSINLTVPILSKKHLIASKKARGENKDIEDIQQLESA